MLCTVFISARSDDEVVRETLEGTTQHASDLKIDAESQALTKISNMCAVAPAKRHTQNEARQQREIEIKGQAVIQLRTMIAGLEREIANLDFSISSELHLSSVRWPQFRRSDESP